MIRKGRIIKRNGVAAPRPLAVIRADQPLRQHGRISQWDTAYLAGISRFRYWCIETGRQEATPDEKRAIARALGVPVSGIVFRNRADEALAV